MPDLTGKKNKKTRKAKIVFVLMTLLLDMFFLPWLIKLPIMLAEKSTYSTWVKYGIFNSMKDVIFDGKVRTFFLILQLGVITFIVAILWNVNKIKKPYRPAKDIGGPEAAGSGQHGTARLMTEKEKDKNCGVWLTTQELKSGGIIFGKEEEYV
ncbi:MAG TPA: hypothetical protein GXX73_14190 [Clostridium sp.]|nr:hypothetical protein [Clostridium sp.]